MDLCLNLRYTIAVHTYSYGDLDGIFRHDVQGLRGKLRTIEHDVRVSSSWVSPPLPPPPAPASIYVITISIAPIVGERPHCGCCDCPVRGPRRPRGGRGQLVTHWLGPGYIGTDPRPTRIVRSIGSQ